MPSSMNWQRSFFISRVPLLLLLIVSAFALPNADRGEEPHVFGVFDGSRQVTRNDFTSGISKAAEANGGNYLEACSEFDSYGDAFVLIVTMGTFKDYFLPAKAGKTLCDVLLSHAEDALYRYSANDPTSPEWDSYSDPVGVSTQWPSALGGSPLGYTRTTRQALSFWGDDGNDTAATVHKGGCCATSPHAEPSWYQPFTLSIAHFEPNLYRLGWLAGPSAVVAGAPVGFHIKLWNARGEMYPGSLSFTILLNGTKHEMTTFGKGNLLFEGDAGAVQAGDSYKVSVTLEGSEELEGFSGPSTVSVTVPSYSSFPQTGHGAAEEMTPCSLAFIHTVLHFGAQGVPAVRGVDRAAALENDWVVRTAPDEGGEAEVHALDGDTLSVKGPGAGATLTTSKWVLVHPNGKDGVSFVSSDEGSDVKEKGKEVSALHFYGFTLYSFSEQVVVMDVMVDDDAVIYMGGTVVVPPNGFSKNVPEGNTDRRMSMFPVTLQKGYQQVFIKQYSRSASDTYLRLRLHGSGSAYAAEPSLEIYNGSYRLESDAYITQWLSPSTGPLPTADAAADLISMYLAAPHAGSPVVSAGSDHDAVWTARTFSGGYVRVSVSDLPRDGAETEADEKANHATSRYAVMYTAFAVRNDNKDAMSKTVMWQLEGQGAFAFFLDGLSVYASETTGSETVKVKTALTPGWHQVIVRAVVAASAPGVTYRLRPIFSGFRLTAAVQIPTGLPPGVHVVNIDEPLTEALALSSRSSITSRAFATAGGGVEAAVPFDWSRTLERENFTFTDFPLTSSHAIYEGAEVMELPNGAAADTVAFKWQPQRAEGSWGAGAFPFAGSFRRYWALSLYLAESAPVTLNTSISGGSFTLWIDGKPIMTEVEGAIAASAAITLSSGWHQVVVKMQSSNGFELVTPTAVDANLNNWLAANVQCSMQLGSEFSLCSLEAYCPLGALRRGMGLSRPTYAPVKDAEDMWVLLSSDYANPECSVAGHEDITRLHSTGAADNKGQQKVGCCRASEGPSFSLSLSTSSTKHQQQRQGALAQPLIGFAYQSYEPIATPTISVLQPSAARTLSIGIDCVTPATTLQYRIIKGHSNDAENVKMMSTLEEADNNTWLTYTSPLKLSASATVVARAVIGTRPGPSSTSQVIIETTMSVLSRSCAVSNTITTSVVCAVLISGVEAGWRAALISVSIPVIELERLYDPAAAASTATSDKFLGLVSIDVEQLAAVFSLPAATPAGEYYVMVYNETSGTLAGAIVAEPLTTAPSSITAGAGPVPVQLRSGAREGDAVAFPQLVSGNSNACANAAAAVAACNALFTDAGATKHAALLTNALSFWAQADTYKGSTLNCLCVCSACYTSYSNGTAQLTYRKGRVSALPTDVGVVPADGVMSEVKKQSPTAKIVLGTLLAVVAVLFIASLLLLIYYVRRTHTLTAIVAASTATLAEAHTSGSVDAHNEYAVYDKLCSSGSSQ